MSKFFSEVARFCSDIGMKIILALVVFIVGRYVIRRLMHYLEQGRAVDKIGKMEPTVRSFVLNLVKILLNIVLILSIIQIVGIPMASVVTVLATAGLAVGMSLQGALGNLAGGIMLMIFRPFNVGDYIAAAGEEGVVKAITLFYTILTTVDNKRVTVPNGTLMNANVTNFSAEPLRRVDLTFACAKSEDAQKVIQVIREAMAQSPKVLDHPDAPFAGLTGGTNEAMEFTARAWANGADYWEVYFDLTERITRALGEAGVNAPAVRVITEQK